jgi:hypothetical protein
MTIFFRRMSTTTTSRIEASQSQFTPPSPRHHPTFDKQSTSIQHNHISQLQSQKNVNRRRNYWQWHFCQRIPLGSPFVRMPSSFTPADHASQPAVNLAHHLTLKAVYSRSLKSAQGLGANVDLYSDDSGSGKTYHDLLLVRALATHRAFPY